MSGTRPKDSSPANFAHVTLKTGIRGKDWRPHRGGEVEIREVLSKTRLLENRRRLGRAVVRTFVGNEIRNDCKISCVEGGECEVAQLLCQGGFHKEKEAFRVTEVDILDAQICVVGSYDFEKHHSGVSKPKERALVAGKTTKACASGLNDALTTCYPNENQVGKSAGSHEHLVIPTQNIQKNQFTIPICNI